MIKLTCSIFKLSNDFIKNFFTYIKISKDSSTKYYQNIKERLQKELVKDIKAFLKKKRKKSENMIMNDIKIFQKMKNESLLSIEEIL